MRKMEKCYNGIEYVRVSKPAMIKHIFKAWKNKDKDSLQIGVCMNKQRILYTVDMYNQIMDKINLYGNVLTENDCVKYAFNAVTNEVYYYNANTEYGFTVCYFIKKGDC